MFYFFEFLCFFLFEFSTLGRVGTEFESNFFFHSYLANFIPVWIEMMPESCFFIFRIFLEFSCTGRVGKEFKTKFFFFLFLVLSHPYLDRTNAKMMCFNFLNFLNFFFGIFLPKLCSNGIRE